MRIIQIAILMAIMCGCASQSNQPSDVADSPQKSQAQLASDEAQAALVAEAKSRMVCRRQRDTGSHMVKTICRTKEQMADDRDKAREVMDRVRIFDEPAAQ